MSPREVNILLTKAALLDPRMKRTDQREQADMAIAWAEVLADVTLADGINAVNAHYATDTRAVTPADIRAHADSDDYLPNVTELDRRRQRDEWLTDHGFAPGEWDHLIAAGNQPADILAARCINLEGITA